MPTPMTTTALGDPQPLFAVTAVVVVGLLVWVGWVLAKVKTPWSATQPTPGPEAPAIAPPQDAPANAPES